MKPPNIYDKKSFFSRYENDSNNLKMNKGLMLTGKIIIINIKISLDFNSHFDTNSKNNSTYKDKYCLTVSDSKNKFLQTSKFENYSTRKNLIDEKKTNKINSYIEPINYSEFIKNNAKKKSPYKIPSINIGRFPSRNDAGLINDNNYPNALTYFPKFDYINPNLKTCKIIL